MDIKEKIAQANEKTVHMLMDSDPVWVDMKPAIECVDGLEDHMILHSGPPYPVYGNKLIMIQPYKQFIDQHFPPLDFKCHCSVPFISHTSGQPQ